MKLIKNLQIEHIKMRHTWYNLYQILCILGSAFVVTGTFFLYDNKPEVERIRIFFDVIAVLFPVMVIISVALMLRQEEQIGNLFGILFPENRKKIIISKLFYSWGYGSTGLILGMAGVVCVGSLQTWSILAQLLLGFLLYGMFFYIVHIFVNLKFGMGVSVSLGIFETMQGMIYTNIHVKGMFRFIPSSWILQWEQNVLEGSIKKNLMFWGTCLLLSLIFYVLLQRWFQHWEGRNGNVE